MRGIRVNARSVCLDELNIKRYKTQLGNYKFEIECWGPEEAVHMGCDQCFDFDEEYPRDWECQCIQEIVPGSTITCRMVYKCPLPKRLQTKKKELINPKLQP